jgi:hypothetical protein
MTVMTSHQIDSLMGSQQAMFGQFQSYASQITPPYAMAQQQAYGGNPMSGYQPNYSSPYGVAMGPAPPPPPAPMMLHPQGQMAGGLQAGGNLAMSAFMQPTSGAPQVLGERIAMTGMNAAQTIGQGLGTISTAAGIASMLGVGGLGMAVMGGTIPAAVISAGGYALNQMGQGMQEGDATTLWWHPGHRTWSRWLWILQ